MRKLLATLMAATVAICLCAGAFAKDNDKGEPKRWIWLRDHPVNYARILERRKENIDENGKDATGVLALGLANKVEMQYPAIQDEKLKKAIEAIVKKLLPPDSKLPPMEIVLVDDLGMHTMIRSVADKNGDEALDRLAATIKSDYHAYATGGGALFLPLGTLHATETPDELAFLLAHEISHLMYDHFTSADRKKTFTKFAAYGLTAALIIYGRGQKGSGATAAASSLGFSMVTNAAIAGWGRDQEREADILGAELMTEFGGYAPSGGIVALEKLDAQEKASEKFYEDLCGSSLGSLFSKKSKPLTKGTDPTNPLCAQHNDFLGDFFNDHPPAAERAKDLKAYLEKWYPNEMQRRVPAPFKNAKGKPVSNFVAFASPAGDANRLWMAYDGIDAVHHKDLPTAKRLFAKVSNRKGKEDVAPVLLLGYEIANAEGKKADAIKYLEKTIQVRQAGDEPFRILSTAYETDKKWADAVRVIKAWQKTTTYPEALYPQLIEDQRQGGMAKDMDASLTACRTVSDRMVVQGCEQHAAPPGEASKAGGWNGFSSLFDKTGSDKDKSGGQGEAVSGDKGRDEVDDKSPSKRKK
jgi:predicted Zn-dependent protease